MSFSSLRSVHSSVSFRLAVPQWTLRRCFATLILLWLRFTTFTTSVVTTFLLFIRHYIPHKYSSFHDSYSIADSSYLLVVSATPYSSFHSSYLFVISFLINTRHSVPLFLRSTSFSLSQVAQRHIGLTQCCSCYTTQLRWATFVPVTTFGNSSLLLFESRQAWLS